MRSCPNCGVGRRPARIREDRLGRRVGGFCAFEQQAVLRPDVDGQGGPDLARFPRVLFARLQRVARAILKNVLFDVSEVAHLGDAGLK